MQLLDLTGSVVSKWGVIEEPTSSNLALQLPLLSKGMYLMRLQTGEKQFNETIIIE